MAKYPVVVYGASGYTGMLIMDWLIDQQIPFTAVARNAKRVQEMMAQRVVRLESATYEIVEAEHTVEALAKAFKGAKVVCNTVGPFVNFGLTAVEAALKAGCHHIDTTGEQGYIRAVRDQFGELYRQAGLLVSPSTAYMYTFAEIAAELALETHGIDVLETATLCRGTRFAASGVTVGSTASIFELFRAEQCYLWEKKLVPHAPGTRRSTSSTRASCSPCSRCRGAAPRCRCTSSTTRACAAACSYVGFYDNNVMQLVHGLGQKWDAEYKNLPREHQDAVIKQIVDSTTPSMPPRERTTVGAHGGLRDRPRPARGGARHGARHHALHLHRRPAGRGRDEAARRRDQQGRLRLGLQGLRPPLPARLPRAARPGAGHRHAALSGPTMAIIDFFDRGWRINPDGRRLHPGRPSLQLRRSRRAVLPDRQRPARRSASRRRPRARSGPPTT